MVGTTYPSSQPRPRRRVPRGSRGARAPCRPEGRPRTLSVNAWQRGVSASTKSGPADRDPSGRSGSVRDVVEDYVVEPHPLAIIPKIACEGV